MNALNGNMRPVRDKGIPENANYTSNFNRGLQMGSTTTTTASKPPALKSFHTILEKMSPDRDVPPVSNFVFY